MTWIAYHNNRLKTEKDGFFIVRPNSASRDVVPISCPICTNMYVTKDDELMHTMFGCCNACANQWAYPNIFRWKEGWRPSNVEAALKRKTKMCVPKIVID